MSFNPELLISFENWSPLDFDLLLSKPDQIQLSIIEIARKQALVQHFKSNLVTFAPELLQSMKPSQILEELKQRLTKIQQTTKQITAISTTTNANERIRDFFKAKSGPRVTNEEKKRMARECPNCCGLIKNGICKYPLCTAYTCDRDCNRLDASRLAARIQNKRGHITASERLILNRILDEKCIEDPACGRCDRVFAE